jgi:hypothetical protein
VRRPSAAGSSKDVREDAAGRPGSNPFRPLRAKSAHSRRIRDASLGPIGRQVWTCNLGGG